MGGDNRLVYSTESGSVCASCRRPVRECRCSPPPEEPLPPRLVARLALERAGRGGKTVTVIYGLPRRPTFLRELAAELRRACGAGGTAYDDRVELQGDHLDRLRDRLRAKGWTVKG